MTNATLEGVYAKLARARLHARDLIYRTNALVDDDGTMFRREFDGEPSKYVYWIDRAPVAEPYLSAIFGDFLTNMRAALDHLYYQLPVLENRVGPEDDNFPILLDQPGFKNGKPRPLRAQAVTNHDVLDALEAVQPYECARRETNGLYILNTLVNTDKHRLLLVVVAALEINAMGWPTAAGAKKPGSWINLNPLHDGDPVARFDFWGVNADPKFDPHLALQARVEHAVLDSDAILRTSSVGNLMRFLYHSVEVEVLDRHFLDFFKQSPRVRSGTLEN